MQMNETLKPETVFWIDIAQDIEEIEEKSETLESAFIMKTISSIFLKQEMRKIRASIETLEERIQDFYKTASGEC
jgi:archaellum component FlaC